MNDVSYFKKTKIGTNRIQNCILNKSVCQSFILLPNYLYSNNNKCSPEVKFNIDDQAYK